MIIAITGNPGVGKHTCARLVAKSLGASIVDINEIVAKDHQTIAKRTDKGIDVNLTYLRNQLSKRLKGNEITIVVGHLAPYTIRKGSVDLVFVLRRSPYDLTSGLEKRGYSKEKVKENVASEILGVILFDSIKAFGRGKVIEIDTTGKSAKATADQVASVVAKFNSGKRPGREKQPPVDWLELISTNGDINKFFDISPSQM